MSDVARQVPAITSQRDTLKPSPEVFVSLAHIEANDNETNAPPQQPEPRMFEMPAAVWRAMIACYTIFLLALLGATGGAHAAFAIAISAVYVTMFFGTARAMLRQSAPQPRCELERPGAALQTAFGPAYARRGLCAGAHRSRCRRSIWHRDRFHRCSCDLTRTAG
jgi:hypothetical protein